MVWCPYTFLSSGAQKACGHWEEEQEEEGVEDDETTFESGVSGSIGNVDVGVLMESSYPDQLIPNDELWPNTSVLFVPLPPQSNSCNTIVLASVQQTGIDPHSPVQKRWRHQLKITQEH